MIIVNEIFTSLQGESSFAGIPCLFIRLTECNLRCSWCDTKYSYHDGESYSVDNLLKIINESKVNLVEFTGGEPLLQKDELIKLMNLINPKKTILLETNGSILVSDIPDRVIKILDYKLPSSGEFGSFNIENFKYLTKKDEIKFVLEDNIDYNTTKDIVKKYDLGNQCTVLISKVSTSDLSHEEIANKIIKDNLNVKYQIQLHKLIWGNKKGK